MAVIYRLVMESVCIILGDIYNQMMAQLEIRQSGWRRAGIRSTNLHIVVEYTMYGEIESITILILMIA